MSPTWTSPSSCSTRIHPASVMSLLDAIRLRGVLGAPTRVLGLSLLLAMHWVPLASASAQGRWLPGDRVVLTSFHLVTALARDERRLYAASENGLQILDLAARRWEMPSGVVDGFPEGESPGALAFDPVERVVWLGTLTGRLFAYEVDFGRWREERTFDVGPILSIVPRDLRGGDGLFLGTPSGWFATSRFSFSADPVPPGRLPPGVGPLGISAEDRLARLDPAFASLRGTLLVDGNARRWPLTDFVRGDREGVYWLATAGDNLYRFDARFMSAEPHRFGLLGDGATALAWDGSRIWYGGDGRGPRRGVTASDESLQDWRYLEAGVSGAPTAPVLDILPAGSGVWFATTQGAFFYDIGEDRWRRPGGPAGDSRVRRLAPGDGGSVFAAGDRGVVELTDGAAGNRPVTGPTPAYALLRRAGSLWVSTDAGLVVVGQGGVPGQGEGPTGPVVDLVEVGDTVWAAGAGALWRLHDGRWNGPLREVSLGGVGRIRRLRTRDGDLWVGGSDGVAVRSADSGDWRYLTVPADIPAGPVEDVLPMGDLVYVATPSGVVRIAWRRAF